MANFLTSSVAAGGRCEVNTVVNARTWKIGARMSLIEHPSKPQTFIHSIGLHHMWWLLLTTYTNVDSFSRIRSTRCKKQERSVPIKGSTLTFSSMICLALLGRKHRRVMIGS